MRLVWTIALLLTTVAAIGSAHLFTNENFGRPERPRRRTFEPPRYVLPVADPHRADFAICAGPIRANCVVDGDTFWFEKVLRETGWPQDDLVRVNQRE
jgi:micrococcal nuclease